MGQMLMLFSHCVHVHQKRLTEHQGTLAQSTFLLGEQMRMVKGKALEGQLSLLPPLSFLASSVVIYQTCQLRKENA